MTAAMLNGEWERDAANKWAPTARTTFERD